MITALSILHYLFFFSSRRRHTRSVSAFLLNRSSDLGADAFSNPASTIPAEEASAPARSQALSSGNAAARYSRVSFPLSAADLPPSPTKSSNLSETAEVPACNVPSRSPLPALAIAPETKLGTASSGLGTLEP